MLHWALTASRFHSCWILVLSSFVGSLETRRALKNGRWSYRHLACQGGVLHLSLTSRQLSIIHRNWLVLHFDISVNIAFVASSTVGVFTSREEKQNIDFVSLILCLTLEGIDNPCPAPGWSIGRSLRIQSQSQLLWPITHANGRSLREPAPHPLMLNCSNEYRLITIRAGEGRMRRLIALSLAYVRREINVKPHGPIG